MPARVRRSISSFALLLAVTLLVIGARASAQVNTDVQIDALKIVGTTLTITGKNFGATAPSVTVGQSTAAVSSFTTTEIVAEIPALSRGTYLVTVVRDAAAGGSSASTLRIE